jgi:GH15 family glucan-1,4-alpha-glucosidase
MSADDRARPQPLDLALIGNSCVAALLDRHARLVWWCFPRFDGDPVFSRLLAGDEEKGFCDVVLHGQFSAEARYVRNTAIVETILTAEDGSAIRVTDFAPRFDRYERPFRPPQIVRRLEPLAGLPRITLRVRPTHNYGRLTQNPVVGSNHIRYVGGPNVMRLTSDAPLAYIVNEVPFPLTRPMSLVFGQDEPFLTAIDATSREFLEHTRDYWLDWTRNLAVPFEWQSEVVRAAITLKNCALMETGAIVAAHTTSIPEAPFSGRNWDYRYCWLRDAYFVVDALNRLGATQTMESYIHYITTIAIESEGPMRPLHGIVPFSPLDEWIAPDLAGFLGQGPVRVGNQAAAQTQNDVYGSVVLAAAQMFIDQRLPAMGDEPLFRMLETLGEKALAAAFEPDAGLWEYRTRERPHTYSATLCWAACDRLARIGWNLGLERAAYWRKNAAALREKILTEAWDESQGALTGAFGEPALDASVLLVSRLGLLPPTDPRFVRTCEAIGRTLIRKGRIMRYTAPDDFGPPETAFLACSFWYVDALASIGRADEARELFEAILGHRNAFGLLSEDIHPDTGQLWGNLPQTYSMAGIIVSATRLSSSWEEAWARA